MISIASPLIHSLKEIKHEFVQQVFLKAVEEDGYNWFRAYLEMKSAHVGRLIVRPESQNKGVGTKLMNASYREI